MEIIQERLEREFNIEMIQTAPTVTYEIKKTSGDIFRIDSPSQLPDPNHVEEIREPFISMNLILPADTVGNLMKLCEDRRGTYKTHRIHRRHARDVAVRDAAGRSDLRFL